MKFEQFARIEREAGLRPANDNLFDNHDVEDDQDDTPTGVALRNGTDRARAEERRLAEAAAINAQLRRIMARQTIGDGHSERAANDNLDWPLGGVLRRERLSAELAIAERYRALYRTSQCELSGQCVEEPFFLHRTKKLKPTADVDAFAAAGFPGEQTPGGEIKYGKGIAKVKPRVATPPKRSVAANDESRQRAKPVPEQFNNGRIVSALDAKLILAELRANLGRLMEPIEDAVLAGMRFEEIGKDAIGLLDSDKTSGAGRALVITGLRTLIDVWHRIDERERKLAAACRKRAAAAGLS